MSVGQAGDKANVVKTSGETADADARDTLESVQDILDDLPKQQAKTNPLVNDVVAANRDINLVSTQGRKHLNILWLLQECLFIDKSMPNITKGSREG